MEAFSCLRSVSAISGFQQKHACGMNALTLRAEPGLEPVCASRLAAFMLGLCLLGLGCQGCFISPRHGQKLAGALSDRVQMAAT